MVDVVDHPPTGQSAKGDTHLSLINPPLSIYLHCIFVVVHLYFTFVCIHLLLLSTLAFHNSCELIYNSAINSQDLHI